MATVHHRSGGAPEDEIEREAARFVWAKAKQADVDALCCAIPPGHGIGWFCTRKPHEAGDHVSAGRGKVWARWAKEG